MTLPGGGADKFGNRYEGFWTVREMLSVLDEKSSSIALELPGEDGKGVEFVVEKPDRKVFYQVKRRNRNNWTINELHKEGVLETFVEKLADPSNHVIFASTHPCDVLKNLTARAQKSLDYQQFAQDFSNKRIDEDFENLRSKWVSSTPEVIFERLQRIHIETISESTLAHFVDDLLIERVDCDDPHTIRVLLADYAIERLHERAITAAEIWAFLDQRGYKRRAWHNDPRVLGKLQSLTSEYVDSIQDKAIGGHWIERAEVKEILDKLTSSEGKKGVVVSGEAGVGKSGVILETVQAIAKWGWPVLAFRLDRLDPVQTPQKLGESLGLPQSPILVLASVFKTLPSVLLIDQLDAVSLTSGRNPDFFNCIRGLIQQAKQHPHIRIVLACRRFDLQNDHRFREIVNPNDGFAWELPVEKLSIEVVKNALKSLTFDPVRFTSRQLDLLATPLHLKLFSESVGAQETAISFQTVNDLYDLFWERKQQDLKEKRTLEVKWNDVIDTLCDYMSKKQVLSMPILSPLEDFKSDWQAMVSEGVLSENASRVAFFHEGFFDYAFARRFVSKGKELVEMLLSEEQHLFRRAQVRQVLFLERTKNSLQYLKNLKRLIFDPQIRFHIRQNVVALLGTFGDPTYEEMLLMVQLLLAADVLEREAWIAIQGSSAWFNVLDQHGQIAWFLANGNDFQLNRTIWFLQTVKNDLPDRIAALTKPYLNRSSDWNSRLTTLFRFQGIPLNRSFFEFFLELYETQAFGKEDFWMLIDDLPKDRPDWACEATGFYLKRVVEPELQLRSNEGQNTYRNVWFPDSYHDEQTIVASANAAPEAFLENVLPFMLRVLPNVVYTKEKTFAKDNIWGHQLYFDRHHSGLPDHLFYGVVKALQLVSFQNPELFRSYLSTLRNQPFETAQLLLIRTFVAVAEEFADEGLSFLSENTERFKIGYDDGHEKASHDLLLALTPLATEPAMKLLETAILNYYPEKKYLQHELSKSWKWALGQLGKAQLKLLKGVAEVKLTPVMKRRKQELDRKFPSLEVAEPMMFGGNVEPPIRLKQAEFMSDNQWLKALERYTSVEESTLLRDHGVGGARELAYVLQQRTKLEPTRFAKLLLTIPTNLNVSYFEAILMGLENASIERDLLMQVIQRCHRIPNKPSGRWLARLFTQFDDEPVSSGMLELVAWYATEDPDPEGNEWRKSAKQEKDDRENTHLLTEGINSARGVAAGSIGSLIFADGACIPFLMPTLEKLVRDDSLAVRACAAQALIGVLKHDRDLAVSLFIQMCDADDELLATSEVERFLGYALYTHYSQLEPTLVRMLRSDLPRVVQVGARRSAIAAFDNPVAQPLADFCMNGSLQHRLGVAEVYGTNYAKNRDLCELALTKLFFDAEKTVRDKAADCFWRISDDALAQSVPLIDVFLDSPAFESDRHLLFTLKNSTIKIPESILKVCERFFEISGDEVGDLSTGIAADAHTVSELIMRQYADLRDSTELNSDLMFRCLNLVDLMVQKRVYDAGKLLELFER